MKIKKCQDKRRRLTAKEILEIQLSKEKGVRLAKRYGVVPSTITYIKRKINRRSKRSLPQIGENRQHVTITLSISAIKFLEQFENSKSMVIESMLMHMAEQQKKEKRTN